MFKYFLQNDSAIANNLLIVSIFSLIANGCCQILHAYHWRKNNSANRLNPPECRGDSWWEEVLGCVMLAHSLACGWDFVVWWSFFISRSAWVMLAYTWRKRAKEQCKFSACFNVPLPLLVLQRRPSRCGSLRLITRLCTHTCWTWRSDRAAMSRASSPDCSPMCSPLDPPATSETLYHQRS